MCMKPLPVVETPVQFTYNENQLSVYKCSSCQIDYLYLNKYWSKHMHLNKLTERERQTEQTARQSTA